MYFNTTHAEYFFPFSKTRTYVFDLKNVFFDILMYMMQLFIDEQPEYVDRLEFDEITNE